MASLISTSPCRILLVILVTLTSFAATALGQTTAARPDRGVNPGGAYAVSDIENINLQNGNVNLAIPLASLPPIAGGKLKLTINAIYNSKLWNVLRNEHEGAGLPYRTYTVDTPTLSDDGGWQIGGNYVLFIRSATDDVAYQMPLYPDPNDGYAMAEWQRLQYNWYKVVLRTPDGAEHDLRPTGNHEMYLGQRTYMWGYFKDTPDSTSVPIQYYSSDGTYLSAIVNPNGHSSGINWSMFLPDGTQVINYASGIQRIRDNNGNSIKIYADGNGTHYQDEQTARELRTTYDPTGNGGQGQSHVFYQTVGGVWESVDINYGHTTVRGKIYKVQDWNAGWHTETQDGAECTRHQELLPIDVAVVREIVFPSTEPNQQRHFTFDYDSDTTETASTADVFFTCGGTMQTYTRQVSIGMGALSHMLTPSGAAVAYTYSLATTHAFISIDGADEMVKETLATKALTHDGTRDTWTYTIPNLGNSSVSSVSNPDGSTSTQHFYPIDPGFALTIGNDNPGAGLVFYTNNGLTETYRHWNMRGTQIATGSNHSRAINSFVDGEYMSFVGTTLMSAKTYQYDYNNNLTQVKEYDWFDSSQVTRDAQGVPTGVPTGLTPLRTTNTSYYNSAPDANSANYYMTRTVVSGVTSILDAPRETTTGPSITRLSYDGQAFDTAPGVGNPTSQSSWDDVDNKWITSSQTYGQYGNLETKTDARGKVTQFFYDDNTHAAPNRVVVDPENSSGQQTMTTAFDFSTGLVLNQTDPNGGISSVDYTNQLLGTVDPFGRPGIALGPVISIDGVNQRHNTTTTYVDRLLQMIVASDLNSEGDKLLKTLSTSDMLGRVVLSEQSEDGSSYTIFAHKVYEQAGKISYSSNPSHNLTTTDGWTRATADTFGRMKEVASFGSSNQPTAPSSSPCPSESNVGKVCTSYDANFTTVTDQAGRQRRSKTDGLGRLVRVDEPGDPSVDGSLGSTGTPNQPTSYGYDALGNLTTVTQGTQTRTFVYDSLSRLRSATNPESGTNSENGTIYYTYDDNGNLQTKTDARGVVATYAYDALNRNTSVTYTNDLASTPAVNRYYDGYRDGLNNSVPNSKGRLWQTETSGTAGSRTTTNGFDVLGRPTSQSQQFYSNSAWSNAFTVTATYDLASHMLTETYPSGHTTSYVYDGAGRTSSFAGNLGDATQRTYSSEMIYSASGAMAKEKFGTDFAIYNKLLYNSRGQLAEILETTSDAGSSDTTWNRGKFVNWYSLQCGTANSVDCNAADNNGNLRKQETFVPNSDGSSTSWYQQYDYDSLNRLQRVHEYTGNTSTDWQQEYAYDRYGNRTIEQDVTKTWGTGINKKDFTVNTANNNRLGVPSGQTGTMTYDNAGNLTTDTYSGAGVTRVYDAENRMTSETQANSYLAGSYTYNADGQRVRRTVSGQPSAVTTWQVYGLGGELLAEYAANAAPASPQKEYGYRNGQLLITADAPAPRTNVALATNGGVATASSSYTSTATEDDSPATANNGDRTGKVGSIPSVWNSAAPGHTFDDWLQIDFNDSQTIGEIDVFTIQDNWQNPSEPTEAMTFSSYGLTSYEVQYWDGSAWLTVSNGSVTGNNKVWRKFIFSPIVTNKIRVLTHASGDGYSRVAELEAWTASSSANINWLVTDQLGTPRMVFDKLGTLANVKRHDYLPFGEEFGLIGGRTTTMGYSAADGVRQKFTQKERDNETGLDYSIHRYYSSTQGRFTSPDPLLSSGRPAVPDSWNRYTYVLNNPLVLVDPDGLDWGVSEWDKDGHRTYKWFNGSKMGKGFTAVNFGKAGSRTIAASDGSLVRISNRGIIREVVYAGPGGGGSSAGRENLNVAAGMVDGTLPFGRQVREGVFGKMGVDTSAPEYENAAKVSAGMVIVVSLLDGAGEVKIAGCLVESTAPTRIYSAGTLLRMGEDSGPMHNFPESFNAEIFQGSRTVTRDFFKVDKQALSNDSIMYRAPGIVNGKAGTFEIGVRPSVSGRTEVITHRFFRPGP